MPSNPILLVDDDNDQLSVYATALTGAGFTVVTAASKQEALEKVKTHNLGIGLIDLRLPDGSGNDLVASIRAISPDFKAIIATAHASIDAAVEALRNGVFDFLIKPIDPQTLLNTITNARSERHHSLSVELSAENASPLGGLLGSSQTMKQVYTTIRAVASSTAPVFITGESGTGKEQAAQAIHALSNVSEGPFITFNCGSMPAGSVETELFGRVAGYDSSNLEAFIGAAEQADGGTLFLDEICALELKMQARLLQLLQTSAVMPIGGFQSKPVKIRIICASSTPPLDAIRAERFRADLYYRLHVVPLNLPPLRERGLDVLEIADAMIARFSAKERRPARTLTKEAKAALLEHNWPGNIRELMNFLWSVVVVSDGPEIHLDQLPSQVMGEAAAQQNAAVTSVPRADDESDFIFKDMTLAQVERLVVDNAIQQAGGSIPRAARALDVSPSTLYRKLESWGNPSRRSKSKT